MKPEKLKLERIAAMFGVSIATVSNALSGKGRVSPDLVDRIRTTAEELGYVPSMAGRALRTGRSGVLGLVLPDIGNPLFPQIAQAIEQAASQHGYGVLIGDSRGNSSGQTEAILRLVDRGVDGLVVIPRRGTRIGDLGCPVAVIDSPSTPGNTVAADHFEGGRQIGEHLFSLGHRKVLIVAGSPLSNVQSDRIAGIKEGLMEAETEVLWLEELEAEQGFGCRLGLAAYARRGFSAFATLSDLTALRALTDLQGSGISVPDDVSVTGFDDLVWSAVVTPSLTTMQMNMAEIASIAIGALVRSIGAANEPSAAAVGPVSAPKDRVPMTLLARQSSGPCRLLSSGHS